MLMKITQKVCGFLMALSAVVVSLSLAQPHKAEAKKGYVAFVGTYTTKTESKGIYAFDFDAATGKLTLKGVAAETPNPSWVVVHPNGRYAYAANESGKQSTITAFSIDAKTAKLTEFNQVSPIHPDGDDPCHLSLDKTGKYLFAAYYSSGNVFVFPILADGTLGAHTAALKDVGAKGPNKERQEGPHAHWVQPSPDNRFVFVSDLGLDAILSYRFDATRGTLTPNDPPLTKLAPGAGPRHAAFSPDGKFFYVVSELNSTVTAFSYDAAAGTFHELQTLSTLPVGFHARNDDAEITVHPTGKFLYASNRGHDSIALFRIDPPTGKLTASGDYSVQGKEPRHFAIDPSGNYLLAEDQLSDKIVTLRIDQKTGALTATGDSVEVPSPVCLTFLPID